MIVTWPSRQTTERALSIKTFIPRLDNKLPIVGGKPFGFGQLPDLQTLGFAQFDSFLHIENSFTHAVPDVNMNGPMLITSAASGEDFKPDHWFAVPLRSDDTKSASTKEF